MISNNRIKNYLKSIYNKKIEDITDDEICNIECVIFSNEGKLELEEESSELLLFKKLKQLIIEDSIITNNILKKIIQLNDLVDLSFIHCYFMNDVEFKGLENIKSLSIDNCYLKNYSMLEHFNVLEKLKIISPYQNNEIDLKNLVSPNINVLVLEKCNLKELNILEKKENITFLSLLNSTYNEKLGFIKNMKSLNNIYLNDGNYYETNNNQKIYNSYIDLVYMDDDIEESTNTK